MASIGKHLSLPILLTLLFTIHSHARDSLFFNKASHTTSNDAVPYTRQPLNNQPQQPNFLPDHNDNVYGLYGHDSVRIHPSSAKTTGGPSVTSTNPAAKPESKQPIHQYHPKNYNPVAYVTEPENLSESDNFDDEERNVHNNPQGAEEEEDDDLEYQKYLTATKNRNVDNYNGGSSLNSADTALNRQGNHFNHVGVGANSELEPQLMIDTTSFENGKYVDAVDAEKYSSNHPYENAKGAGERNEYDNRNYYGSGENGYDLNGGQTSNGGYLNQYEFHDDDENNN